MAPSKGTRMQMKNSDITVKKISKSNNSEESTVYGLNETTRL